MIMRLSIGALRVAAAAMKRKPIHPEDVSSVALVELTGLGDVISMLPAVRAFRSLFPSSILRLVVDNRFVELLVALKLPATVHGVVASRTARGVTDAIRLLRDMNPTLACSMSPPRRNALLVLASGAPAVAGYLRYTDSFAPYLLETPVEAFGLSFAQDDKYGRDHISERALKVCRALGFQRDVAATDVQISAPALDRVRSHLLRIGLFPVANYVIIHPFAGWKYREWPQQEFAALAARIVDTLGTKVVFLWEQEKEGSLRFLRQQFAGNASVLFAPSLSLLESSVLISGSSLFVGNDSGPLHLASALGVPVVGLFGPSDPSLTAPRTISRSRWLYHRAECSPCDQRRCIMATNPCMHLISLDEVFAAALSLHRSRAHA